MTRPNTILTVALALGGTGLMGWATFGLRPGRVAMVEASGPGGRVSEPVVVAGSQVPAFAGLPAGELELWAFHEAGSVTPEDMSPADQQGTWAPVRLQLDERDATGAIVEREDGVLDANDELVFMAGDLGVLPTEALPPWPPGITSHQDAIEIRVTDPLDPAEAAFGYLYHTTTGLELGSHVTFDPATGEISSAKFRLGFADQQRDGFIGVRLLELFGSGQPILDRMKIRIEMTLLGVPQTTTEETLAALLTLSGQGVVKSGPVRIVLSPSGRAAAYEGRIALGTGLENFDPSSIPSVVEIQRMSVAFDFLPAAGPGTYRDANLATGVAVDGQPDNVPASPLTPWREIDLPSGRVVFLGHAAVAASTARNHYRDNLARAPGDTGDGSAFGELGVQAATVADLDAAGFPGDLVIMRHAEGPTADRLLAERDHPLEVRVRMRRGGGTPNTLYLPAAHQS